MGGHPELFPGAYVEPTGSRVTVRRDSRGRWVKVPGAARLVEDGRLCRDCLWFRDRTYHRRGYFKCAQIGDSFGPGTDKRWSDPACTFWEARDDQMTRAEFAEARRQLIAAGVPEEWVQMMAEAGYGGKEP